MWQFGRKSSRETSTNVNMSIAVFDYQRIQRVNGVIESIVIDGQNHGKLMDQL